jgi:hypothetical protein
MTDEITILSKTDALWSEKPPFCFALPFLFSVMLIFAAVSNSELFPLISVIVGVVMGYPLGRLYAWADITNISEIATEFINRPKGRIVGRFIRPDSRNRSQVIKALTGIVVIFIGVFGNLGAIYITALLFPTIHKPWIPFDGVRLEDVLYTVFKPAVFIYACVVMWMLAIGRYQWFHSLKDS